jgi:hypothetical protein
LNFFLQCTQLNYFVITLLCLKKTINNIKTDTPIIINVLSIGKPGGGGGVGGGGKLLVPFSMIIVIFLT